MNISQNTARIIQNAIHYTKEHNYEYVTPEILLYALCQYPDFIEAFSECDGDIDVLQTNLKDYIETSSDCVEGIVPDLSIGSIYALSYAENSAANSGNEAIEIRHLIHGIWHLEESYAVYFLEQQSVMEADLLMELSILEKESSNPEISEKVSAKEQNQYPDLPEMDDTDSPDSIKPVSEKSASAKWKLYAPCLNETLHDINPLIGREAELERTIQILCRKDKNNPLHIGEPGVGKTAITYGLVQRIREKKVPKPLQNCKIFALDLGSMLAGTQYRGDFEKRLKKVLSKIEKEESPIIYIDEIHTLSGAGAVGESSFDAANMLKPYLASGHIRFIGATTFEEYKKYFEKNKSLARRFQNVEIKEPTEEETTEILKGLRKKYEQFHGVIYEEDVLPYAVTMSAKHIHERFLPDKAIDLMDEAGAYRKLHLLPGDIQIVDKTIISEVLTKICRVPIETVKADDISGLSTLEERLKNRIFGQDEAISQVVNAIKFAKAGLLEDGRPLASLLFVGPTGVGKTEIARSLSEELGIKLIRFDMSEYAEKHAVAKLIGSPAGYVGYEEGGLLTEAIRKNPFSVLLLDEFEKAHTDIYNVLLQVMDYATLTDNQGRKADFRNVIVIMTSNAGANRIGTKGIGFQSTNRDSSVVMEEVKHTFQPEFRNRLNRIVVFHSMDSAMASRIVDKKLGELSSMLAKKNIRLQIDESTRKQIRKKGISEEFGAREVDRIIRNEIKPLLVDEILFGNLQNGGELLISAKEDSFAVSTI